MDYGKLLSRSANIVWQHKFLIILGFLASLGSGSFSGGGGGGNGGGQPGQLPVIEDEFAALATGAIIALACVFFLIALVLWVISTVARGGMIASVDGIESGEKSGFRQAWSAGWSRVWTLLGIGILPAIPGLILFVAGLLAFGAYGGLYALLGEEIAEPLGAAGLGVTMVVLLCIVIPIVLILTILRTFAERAAMLEGLGVIASYRRGTSVLMANLGQAIILFLLQIVIFFLLGVFLFLPGLILALCCFLWPLLLVIQGAISAYISTLWTLAWRSWMGETPMVEKAPTAV